jgi:hypothetical protein
MSAVHLILIVLVVLIVLSIPWGPGWSPGAYGYYPGSLLGIIVVVLLILLLTGRL